MTSALDFFVLAVVHGSAVAAAVWALEALLRTRVSPALSCALWTVALAKFFVPIGPMVTLSFPPALSRGALAFADPLVLVAPAGAAAASWPWPSLLFALYLLAVAVLATNRLAAARRLASSIDALPLASPALLASVRDAALALKLRRLPAVRIGSGPFVAGWWRPTLVVPFERCDTGEARAMLLHELAHLRRGDPWVRALQNLAQLVFFFWPPVRWVNHKIEQHRELACDQLALEHGALSPAAYARVLLEAQRGAVRRRWQVAVLEMSSQASRLEKRIDMVLEMNRRRPMKWTVLAVVSGAALALSGTALAGETGSKAPAGAGDEEPIKAVVHQHSAQIRACYEAALLSNAGLEGKLVFGWSISPNGGVADGCVLSSDFKSDVNAKLSPEQEGDLWQCISAQVRQWRFPPPKSGEKVEVSYPFVFKQAAIPLVANPDEP